MDTRLCQYMLCSHGVLPSVTIKIPLKEKLLMWDLIKKESREIKKQTKKK